MVEQGGARDWRSPFAPVVDGYSKVGASPQLAFTISKEGVDPTAWQSIALNISAPIGTIIPCDASAMTDPQCTRVVHDQCLNVLQGEVRLWLFDDCASRAIDSVYAVTPSCPDYHVAFYQG
jgi:hypothetical protein